MKCLKFIILMLAVTVFASCGKKQEPQTEKKEEHHEENSNEVSLTPEQIKLMGIKTKPINDVNISGYIKVTGEVKINQDQESKVGGIISGRVKSVSVKEGSTVRAGQVLATIENVELVGVQSDYISAKNELEYAKQELDRQRRISDLTSQKTLAELEANYKRALTNVRSIEQRLSSYRINKNRLDNILDDTTASVQRYYSIVAPIGGNIIERTISVGQFVEPSTEMFHIVNTSSVIVDLNIFEKDLSRISKGQKVQIETSTFSGEVFMGNISNINTVFDDVSRTVKVRVLIQNKNNRLLPNMFVTAKILVDEGNVKAVPKSALIEEGEAKYIFVKTDEYEHSDNKADEHKHSDKEGEHKDEDKHEKEYAEGTVFKKILVRIGIEDDSFIEIFPITKLDDDNEIVTEGTFFLRSELKKDELGEHDH